MMTIRGNDIHSAMRGGLLWAAVIVGLAACSSSGGSSDCATVDRDHLRVPDQRGGEQIVCDPNQVAPEYRDRYFPDDNQG